MQKVRIFAENFGPVVQWIERKFPKLLIRVRFPAGLLPTFKLTKNKIFVCPEQTPTLFLNRISQGKPGHQQQAPPLSP